MVGLTLNPAEAGAVPQAPMAAVPPNPGAMPQPDPASLGAAITPSSIPGTPTGAGPPANAAELASRTAGWHSFLTDPRTLAFLGQMGINLGSSYDANQTPMGHVLGSIAAGGQAAGRVDTAEEKQAQQDLLNKQNQMKINITQQQADTEKTQAANQGKAVGEKIATGEFNRGPQYQLDVQKQKDEAKYRTDANAIASGQLALDHAKLLSDAPYKTALATEADAQASHLGVVDKQYQDGMQSIADQFYSGDVSKAKAWIMSSGILAKANKATKTPAQVMLDAAAKLVSENTKARAVDPKIPEMTLGDATEQVKTAYAATTAAPDASTPVVPGTPKPVPGAKPAGKISYSSVTNTYWQDGPDGKPRQIAPPPGAPAAPGGQ